MIGTGRRADRLQALADELGAAFHPLAFDITDEDALDAALNGLPPEFAEIDWLINNAGLALGTKPAQDSDLAQWRTMIATNIDALITITHRLLPRLIARRGGSSTCPRWRRIIPIPAATSMAGPRRS